MKRSACLRAPGYNDWRLPSVTAPLPDIQLRTKRAAPPPMFVFGESERRLNHSRTEPSGYHVLQKCDKAQQLRALAPPPPGSFFPPLLPSLDLLSCVAPPPLNPFRDVTTDLPLSAYRPCMGPPSLRFSVTPFHFPESGPERRLSSPGTHKATKAKSPSHDFEVLQRAYFPFSIQKCDAWGGLGGIREEEVVVVVGGLVVRFKWIALSVVVPGPSIITPQLGGRPGVEDLPHSNLQRGAGGGLMEWMTHATLKERREQSEEGDGGGVIDISKEWGAGNVDGEAAALSLKALTLSHHHPSASKLDSCITARLISKKGVDLSNLY
ncbi:unnamed protein product [Pleuronectes platessa]|uniref:Uncharacterized protein n=1 Tax=Pleuronectes platessa TaxID=8262 RepID=A0A9N7VUY8_PLEPL|nr:unnamed protein product [Pleuronectes platessa]